MENKISGVVPVMLTPFTEQGVVDFDGLAKLVEWYLHQKPGALFAVCQSSEMQKLTLTERQEIARCTVNQAKGRVPVVASGHIADLIPDQIHELNVMAETGVDGIVLVTNRLDTNKEGFETFRSNLKTVLNELPSGMPLGLYECPAPYRRLLTDDEIKLCSDTGRFIVLKDVSCDLNTVKRRLKLVEGSDFSIINANAAIAFEAMNAGSQGFAGVFTNFHSDLYVWLRENKELDHPIISELVNFLALAACAEPIGYPGLAKIFHQRLGTFQSIYSRVIDYDLRQKHWAIDDIVAHIETGSEAFRARIAQIDSSFNHIN